ncbi:MULTISPECIES: VOC family protein [unclassified Leptolyngbya]|nr:MULTISPECIES: VOC family protein [unclassified Leptolyngbya]MBD1911799.1 VOC family protein [Leptolyngbya sp. FACHB-8]MBD2153311.1 VOC family protein [Leptolyngbya sp. FACHB-16]
MIASDRPFQITALSPILSVADVERAIAFYCDYLGFTQRFLMPDTSYGIVELQGHPLHLSRPEDPSILVPAQNQSCIYIAVTGIEALWAQIEAAKPPTRVFPLSDRPWGMKEFGVIDPDGCLIRVGEAS